MPCLRASTTLFRTAGGKLVAISGYGVKKPFADDQSFECGW
jgi:hypothetical protein